MTRHKTASDAVQILLDHPAHHFDVPTREQLRDLRVAFAKRGQVLYGRAFDIVLKPDEVGLDHYLETANGLDELTICEVKSTNRKSLNEDFSGYFFALTTAELLVAQSLGDQYKFVFVNTVTGKLAIMPLQNVFARARKIYPTWSITF